MFALSNGLFSFNYNQNEDPNESRRRNHAVALET